MALCAKCGGDLEEGAAFCAVCGGEVAGATPAVPKTRRIGDKYAKQVHGGNVKSGRGAILAVSILMAIGGVAFYFILGSAGGEQAAAAPVVLGVNLVLSAVFLGLWFWAKINPLAASITALAIYVTVQLADMIMAPENIAKGIIVKIIIVLALARAIKSAVAYRNMQESGR